MIIDNRVTMYIDGREIKARPGAVALEAAMEAGIYIPYLCYHPGMKPFAACRMCLVQEEVEVEVERDGEKVKEVQLRPASASCTMPIRDGMVLRSATENLRDLQKGIMEMLISEHPHGCLTCHRVELCGPEDICLRHVSVNDRCVFCPKNERCEFKDSVRYLGMELSSPLSYKTRDLEVEVSDPFYDRDYNLCIVCARCVRVCEEVRGDNAITMIERAGQALVGTSQGTSLLESGCEFCGACLDVCPVGALVEREHKWDKAERVEQSVCPNCPVGCQMNLEIDKRERLIRAIPEFNAAANHGQACYKGKFGLEFVNHRDRLKHPMIRQEGELREATWDEALELIARRLPEYPGKQFAALASARTNNEAAYLLQKFARTVMHSNNIDVDSNSRPALTRALEDPLGYAASTNPVWEIEQAQCILVVDANVTEEHNVVGIPIKRAVKAGSNLIVIDAREVELTRHATRWLRPRPGTTLTLLSGIVGVVLEENLLDQEFVQQQCEGLDELRASLRDLDVHRVADITGVSVEDIRETAIEFSRADASAIVYALDNVAHAEQANHVYAIANLSLLTGNIGKPSAGLFALQRGGNSQGIMDVGVSPDLLPGYLRVKYDGSRMNVQETWGLEIPSDRGMDLFEMLEGARQGKIKAMFLLGDNANYSNGELGDGYGALDQLEFLVVQDAFLGAAAQRADVVLPGATFAEEDGTYTNVERRVQLLSKALSPRKVDARPSWEVLCQLGKLMGSKGFEFETSSAIFDEIASVSSIYGGISHQRIRREAVLTLRPDDQNPLPTQILHSGKVANGIQWPCPRVEAKGTPILYTAGFPGGRARLMQLEERVSGVDVAPDYPLTFVPGRVLAQEDRDIAVERIGNVNQIRRELIVEVNLDDAEALGIVDGDYLDIVTPSTRLRGLAGVVGTQHKGVISATFLFGELMTKLQASEDPDPMAKVPGLVFDHARLEKIVR